MSDSDSDTSNVFNLQNVNTTIFSAQGPNTNITNMSLRNHLTSTMCMSQNFERQRYAESAYDQRSMYYRRETSPASIRSACDIRQRNFQQYYPGSSHKSVFNGRCGSPMSMRSIDSNASVSAADIAFAFKNAKFNKYDLKVIKEAYHKLMKQRVRKRIERRRNMRLFLKGSRRRSGDDSGEQGSNSSISSDDCRSVQTCKENMSSNRSARIDLTHFRKTLRDSNIIKDCTDNFRQNTFKNKFSVGSISSVNSTQILNNNLISKQINPIPSQKDRFRNGFLLPSQRFNQSVASSVIPEKSENSNKNNFTGVKNYYAQNKNNNCTSGSEEEEIFQEMSVQEKTKRRLDSEDESSLPERKKSKISSPNKYVPKNKGLPSKPKNLNPSSDNFEFAKPTLPVRKSKPMVQEKLIAKCSQPLTEFLEPISDKKQGPIPALQPSNIQEKSKDNLPQLEQSETAENSDVSMRPSFIKRKLFTQKLDVAEKANLSSDGTRSPVSNGQLFQKEKNKARKLVTNQSCLNREVQDDNNLLDLIHKIVPPDRMNITNQSNINQTKTDVNIKKKIDEDKWDVTSVISMCNEDDVSDTYTDEEIFEGDCKKDRKKNKGINPEVNPKTTDKVANNIVRNSKIVIEDIKLKQVNNQNFNLAHNNATQKNCKSAAKSFWDTDLESDAECQSIMPQCHIIDNLKKANATSGSTKQVFKEPIGNARSQGCKYIPEVPKNLNNTSINSTVMNNTVGSMRKFNSSTLTIRSHRTSKKKICGNDTCTNETLSNLNKKDNSLQEYVEKMNSKTDLQTKHAKDLPKAKLPTQNENLANKMTSHSKKSPKGKKVKKDKQEEITKKKSESKSNIACNIVNNKVPSDKPEKQMIVVKNKTEKHNESTKAKNSKSNTKNDGLKNKKETQNKSPKNKAKLKTEQQSSSLSNNNTVSQSKSNLNNTVACTQNTTLRSDRPIRSCRTPKHSSSIELSRSQLNNTIDANRTLRSRVINLSSSIENITIKIKPKRVINKKKISHSNTRVSDISFSLGHDKATPTPKKNLARTKTDIFKGKRKN